MQLLIFPLIAFAPGVFWLWFFAKRHIYRPGPKRLLIQTFFLGMVSIIPAAILEAAFLDDLVLEDSANASTVATSMLFVVGPVEEASKFLAVRLVAYRSLYFDEPMDGLVYAAAASLGFASLENLFYVFSFGAWVMIGRAPLSTVGHVIFGSFWGYALDRESQEGLRRSWLALAAGIGAAAIFHGLFNTAIFTLWPIGLVLLCVGCGGPWAGLAGPKEFRIFDTSVTTQGSAASTAASLSISSTVSAGIAAHPPTAISGACIAAIAATKTARMPASAPAAETACCGSPCHGSHCSQSGPPGLRMALRPPLRRGQTPTPPTS